MSRFLHHDKPATTGPGGPSGQHRFVEPADARSGLAMSATQPNLQMGPAMAVADASLRVARCGMAGCGKTRQDAIHQPHD